MEFAPFAATLAQRLARLVSRGRLAPGQPLWTLAVDGFLLRACDTEGQVTVFRFFLFLIFLFLFVMQAGELVQSSFPFRVGDP